jgi:nucleotide-binding universal stress UspA family protein
MNAPTNMSNGDRNMYKRILVPIDGSPTAEAGLREAIKLASGHPDSTIRLLHVLEPLPALQGMEVIAIDPMLENMTAFGQKILKNAKAHVESNGIRAETSFQKASLRRAADGIEQEAAKWRADLIVMGTHGRRGIDRLVMGSDAESVLRVSSVPVLMAKARTAGKRR